jgi:hypothetical protein
MCRRVQCVKCGRPSYAGCGAHVEQVLADVPAKERCRCREDSHQATEPRPKHAPAATKAK